jgi:UDP-3-O-[3-hydroxymyristoyl] N-acetylglucosamine deacetylase
MALTAPVNRIDGIGLITGKPCFVGLAPATKPGIWFVWPDGDTVQAIHQAVHTSERGVTLVSPGGQQVSIVEHFLAACALAYVENLTVYVSGPELPILDGSAAGWMPLVAPFATGVPNTLWQLTQTIRVDVPGKDIYLEAIPAPVFSVTYAVDFPHPSLKGVSVSWSPKQPNALQLAEAGTFGLTDELAPLQAKGLALGVTPDNTLGLNTDGTTTRPLRFPLEPAYHKVLDCLGDMMLMGINPLQCGMALTAHKAGHTSHLMLLTHLRPLLHARV